jgi:hypothetical protein
MNSRYEWSQPKVARVQLVRELRDPTPARDHQQQQQQQPQLGMVPDQPLQSLASRGVTPVSGTRPGQLMPGQGMPEARPKRGRPPKNRNQGQAAAAEPPAAAAAAGNVAAPPPPPHQPEGEAGQPKQRGRPKGARGARQLAQAQATALRDPNPAGDPQPQPDTVREKLHQSPASGGAPASSGTVPGQKMPGRPRGRPKGARQLALTPAPDLRDPAWDPPASPMPPRIPRVPQPGTRPARGRPSKATLAARSSQGPTSQPGDSQLRAPQPAASQILRRQGARQRGRVDYREEEGDP